MTETIWHKVDFMGGASCKQTRANVWLLSLFSYTCSNLNRKQHCSLLSALSCTLRFTHLLTIPFPRQEAKTPNILVFLSYKELTKTISVCFLLQLLRACLIKPVVVIRCFLTVFPVAGNHWGFRDLKCFTASALTTHHSLTQSPSTINSRVKLHQELWWCFMLAQRNKWTCFGSFEKSVLPVLCTMDRNHTQTGSRQ